MKPKSKAPAAAFKTKLLVFKFADLVTMGMESEPLVKGLLQDGYVVMRKHKNKVLVYGLFPDKEEALKGFAGLSLIESLDPIMLQFNAMDKTLEELEADKKEAGI